MHTTAPRIRRRIGRIAAASAFAATSLAAIGSLPASAGVPQAPATITPSTAAPGETVTLAGTCPFNFREDLSAVLDGTRYFLGNDIPVNSGTGAFSGPWTLPEDIADGVYNVDVDCDDGEDWFTTDVVSLTIDSTPDPTTPTTPTTVPNTTTTAGPAVAAATTPAFTG